ncbi:MAG: sugar transferase [archaeon]
METESSVCEIAIADEHCLEQEQNDFQEIEKELHCFDEITDNPIYNFITRILDIILSVLGLIITLPALLVIAVMIKLEDGGSIFFKHNRIGENLENFKMYKFRTMVPNAEKKLKETLAKDREIRKEFYANFKLKNDPRITKIGKFLRKTSLDELPQLINVLKGDMSLVGPRPIVEDELHMHYKEMGQIIFSIKPGVTGMWQAYARSDVENYKDRIALDLGYIIDRSLLLDLKILFQTVKSVLKKEGAY